LIYRMEIQFFGYMVIRAMPLNILEVMELKV
jgi:hypothetical protein